MSYFADLTEYTYFSRQRQYPPVPGEKELVNVGWLDIDHEFTTGDVPSQFIVTLKYLLDHNRCQHTRGAHECPYCPDARPGYIKDQTGSAEIRVPSGNIIYCCPELIYHYVLEHGYKPPQEFIDATLEYDPNKQEYEEDDNDLTGVTFDEE
jgi:hypothetical protein